MKNERSCPICGKEDEVIAIIYGLPVPLDDALEKEASGEMKLGGCMIIGGAHQPVYHCKRDDVDFGDLDVEEGW